MFQRDSGAQGATPTGITTNDITAGVAADCVEPRTETLQPQAAAKGKRRSKSARAQPYQSGRGTWSARTRREGAQIFVSGLPSRKAAEDEMNQRVAAMALRGKPHGAGPERTTVAKAFSDHALLHLPSLKGGVQEARRINKYLRAAGLPTLEARRIKGDDDRRGVPEQAVVGAYCAVWLVPHASERSIPKGLGAHRKKLLTRTGGSDRVREVLARTKVAHVTRELLQDLVRALEAEGLAAATVLQEVAMLKRLFNHCIHAWNWPKPARNPASFLKLAGQLVERERVMSVNEERRLDQSLDTCINEKAAAAFVILTETAMRAEECLGSCWGDVDWDKRLLRLKDAKAGARNVPLSPRALEMLRKMEPSEDPTEPIFGITYESLKAAWRRACERAGVADLHIQDLRHTAATRMALKTGNIFIVQRLTGHKCLSMVTRYTNVKAEDVVEVMHAPAPSAPAAGVPAVSDEAMKAAMQMLQAAAVQMATSPAHVPALPAACGLAPSSHAANDGPQAASA